MTTPPKFFNARQSEHLPQQGMVDALGQSNVFLEFQEKLSKVAPVNRPVLLFGERGTGKEIAASRLHFLSNRWQNPFITLNCSALSPSLIESELFGHERGAFTSASRQRTGRFEMADQGSFFLDEIGSIPLEAQEKILRVVEYGSFERVGSSNPIHVDVRIIAATNIDLAARAAEAKFMRDLLDRLSFEVLYLPPLRERHGDISLLAHHFAARMAFEVGRDAIPRFSHRALTALEAYHWPGNIRELKNVVERAVYRSKSTVINSIIFNPFENPYATTEPKENSIAKEIQPTTPPQASFEDEKYAIPFHDAVWELKVQLLEDALTKANFNQKKAARILGMTYHQFRALYRKYRDKLQL